MVHKKVGVVTVTYGERYPYISQTLEATLKLTNVEKIILVINGVLEPTLSKLKAFSSKHSKIIIHDLGYNSGSAKGFSEGIKKILNEDIEYIWLLDDDNLPNMDALKQLLDNWKIHNKNNSPVFSLLSYRNDRNIYKDAIQTNNPYLMLGSKNSFLGFHLGEKLKRIASKKELLKNNNQFGNVAVAPYGGMFFLKELINEIGLPNESFFLYADDHEFSYRITKKNGKIVLLLDSILKDLETSFHLKKASLGNTRFFSTDSKNVIFYSVRNNVFFENFFITNTFTYLTNKYFYIFMLFFLMLLKPKHFWKYPLILKAIRESNNFMND